MDRSLRLALAGAALAVAVAGTASAQTVDEIVAKNLAARGGVERLKALESAKITGDVLQQGMKIHVVTYAKRPNMMRRDMESTIPPGMPPRAGGPPPGTKVKTVIAFDGTNVWVMNSLMGDAAQPMTGPQGDLARQDADFDSVLMDYKAKGHKVELVGKETIDGKSAYHLRVTKKIGFVQEYYLDAETGLEMRTSSVSDQNGERSEIRTDLSDYRTVNGLTMPFTMKQSINGKPVAEVSISTWEVNVPIDDGIFRMPAAKQ